MPARAATLGLALAGCYLSHGLPADAGVDAGGPCEVDRDCDDREPCTRDLCEGGRCVHEPIPLVHRESFASSGSIWGTTSHRGEAIVAGVAGSSAELMRFAASGPLGAIATIPVEGGRAWDTSIASTGDDIAIVTVEDGQLALRMASAPDAVERAPGGIFADVTFTGRELVVAHEGATGCDATWASVQGRWIEGSRADIASCGHTQVLTTGHPTSRRPMRVEPGSATFLSFSRGDGTLGEDRMSPGLGEPTPLTLVEPGPRFFHSMVALERAGVIAGIWVRTEDDTRRDVHFGVLRRSGSSMTPASIDVMASDDAPYALRMAIDRCAGRWIGAHLEGDQVWVRQMDDQGRAVAPPFAVTDSSPTAGRRTIACFDGGAILTTWSEVHTLSCP